MKKLYITSALTTFLLAAPASLMAQNLDSSAAGQVTSDDSRASVTVVRPATTTTSQPNTAGVLTNPTGTNANTVGVVTTTSSNTVTPAITTAGTRPAVTTTTTTTTGTNANTVGVVTTTNSNTVTPTTTTVGTTRPTTTTTTTGVIVNTSNSPTTTVGTRPTIDGNSNYPVIVSTQRPNTVDPIITSNPSRPTGTRPVRGTGVATKDPNGNGGVGTHNPQRPHPPNRPRPRLTGMAKIMHDCAKSVAARCNFTVRDSSGKVIKRYTL